MLILVVEDEYAVAADLAWWLEDSGAAVIGPAPTVQEAMALIRDHGQRLIRAVLDVNLRGEKVFPVADALVALGIPFIFCTGYEGDVFPPPYVRAARQAKPLDRAALTKALVSAEPWSGPWPHVRAS